MRIARGDRFVKKINGVGRKSFKVLFFDSQLEIKVQDRRAIADPPPIDWQFAHRVIPANAGTSLGDALG